MTGIQGWGQGLQSNVLQRQAAPAHTQVSLCTFLQNRDLLPRNEKDLQQFALRMYRKSFRVSEFDDSSPATFSNRSAFLRNLHDEWWQDIKKLVNLLYNQCRWVKNGFSNSSYTRNGSFTNDERLSSNPRWAPATDVPCNKGKSTLNSKKNNDKCRVAWPATWNNWPGTEIQLQQVLLLDVPTLGYTPLHLPKWSIVEGIDLAAVQEEQICNMDPSLP